MYGQLNPMPSGITTGPSVAHQLFEDHVHQGIINFLDTRIPTMVVSEDRSDFIRRYVHNLPFFVDIHRQLVDFASHVFNEKVKPSYCFLSMYEDGGKCPLHVDRPQCRYTIDYLVRQDQPEPWLLHISDQLTDKQREDIDESNAGRPSTIEDISNVLDSQLWHTIKLAPNDAVMYSGTHSWHYRSQKLKGNADLVFFHFVPESFNGPLD